MLRDKMTCDFTHARAYSRNKWITVSHPFSRVGYKTVIAVDISPRSLFIIAECVLQAYTVCRYVSQNDVTSSRWLRSGLTRQPDTPDIVLRFLRVRRKHMDRVLRVLSGGSAVSIEWDFAIPYNNEIIPSGGMNQRMESCVRIGNIGRDSGKANWSLSNENARERVIFTRVWKSLAGTSGTTGTPSQCADLDWLIQQKRQPSARKRRSF